MPLSDTAMPGWRFHRIKQVVRMPSAEMPRYFIEDACHNKIERDNQAFLRWTAREAASPAV
jgi:hypothetical protein